MEATERPPLPPPLCSQVGPRNLLMGLLIPSLRLKRPPLPSLSSEGNLLPSLLFPSLRFGAGQRRCAGRWREVLRARHGPVPEDGRRHARRRRACVGLDSWVGGERRGRRIKLGRRALIVGDRPGGSGFVCSLRDFDDGFYDVPSDRSGFFDVRFRFFLGTTFFYHHVLKPYY
jgi:hypothetical protein